MKWRKFPMVAIILFSVPGWASAGIDCASVFSVEPVWARAEKAEEALARIQSLEQRDRDLNTSNSPLYEGEASRSIARQQDLWNLIRTAYLDNVSSGQLRDLRKELLELNRSFLERRVQIDLERAAINERIGSIYRKLGTETPDVAKKTEFEQEAAFNVKFAKDLRKEANESNENYILSEASLEFPPAYGEFLARADGKVSLSSLMSQPGFETRILQVAGSNQRIVLRAKESLKDASKWEVLIGTENALLPVKITKTSKYLDAGKRNDLELETGGNLMIIRNPTKPTEAYQAKWEPWETAEASGSYNLITSEPLSAQETGTGSGIQPGSQSPR